MQADETSADTPPPHFFKATLHKLIPHTKSILAICAIAALTGVLFVILNRQVPTSNQKSVRLAGINIANMDKEAARKELTKAAENQKILISIDSTTYTFAAKDLGVKRDVASLLDASYAPPNSLINKLTVKQTQATSLTTYVNKAQLVSAIEAKLGPAKLAKNASVSVEGSSIIAHESSTGLTLDFDSLIQQLSRSDLQNNLALTANFTRTNPDITTDAANTAKAQAEAFMANDFGITSTNGNRFVTEAQQAAWLTFSDNPSDHSIGVAINNAAARATMAQLAQSFSRAAKDRLSVSINGNPSLVIDEGQNGTMPEPASLNTGLAQFEAALNARQSYMLPVTIVVQPPGERDLGPIDASKSILVYVPYLKAYTLDSASLVRTMWVSTGVPSMPTPAGHFKIRQKIPLLTMTGCNKAVGCWTVPDVPNVEFFTPEGHAFHGTYWHNMFGRANMSHGCVNLSLADAEWLYGWTEVGTDVYIFR